MTSALNLVTIPIHTLIYIKIFEKII